MRKTTHTVPNTNGNTDHTDNGVDSGKNKYYEKEKKKQNIICVITIVIIYIL